MKNHLILLICCTGVIPLVLSVPRKYYLIQQGKTWSDAQAYCRAKHTDLAIIQSNDNMVRLQSDSKQFSSSAWIGLFNDINSWHWSFGNEALGSMRQWAIGQPDNRNGDQECAVMNLLGWYDKTCTDPFPFVCFDDNKIGTGRYIYISSSKTWYEAQAYCRTYHTDLASARNAIETAVLAGLISGSTWFGLFRNSWKWTDQTNFSTLSWVSGHPDAQANENCGYLNNGQVANAQCSDIMPFICYSEITGKQQIIRVKIRSNQDVNNPEVSAALLKQIKEKLKDHGMTNSTVQWKEQPDGKVFQRKEKI